MSPDALDLSDLESLSLGMRLYDFVRESNRIEGIEREPTQDEVRAAIAFLHLEAPTVEALETFVEVCQPGAKLRTKPGMNVRVGDHRPSPGGPEIANALDYILLRVAGETHPYEVHRLYETLHPFMDGNGRSGRILWAWQMVNQRIAPGLSLGFLHAWYYQSLAAGR